VSKITLEALKNMKPKEICYHKLQDFEHPMKAFDYMHENHNINNCDLCGQLSLSTDLHWVNNDLADALCDECYDPYDDEDVESDNKDD